jgi:hypothetical protein
MYRMGYHGRATVHGFRAMASTALNEMGFHPDVIERQLAHQDWNAVRAAYNRAEYISERRTMMKRWADYLDSLGGKNIVALSAINSSAEAMLNSDNMRKTKQTLFFRAGAHYLCSASSSASNDWTFTSRRRPSVVV